MVFPDTVWPELLLLLKKTIPPTDTILLEELYAFAMVKSLIVLFDITFEPSLIKMPFIKPGVLSVVLVDPLVKLEMVLPVTVKVLVALLYIP